MSCGQRPVGSVLWAESCGQRPVGRVLWAASCGQSPVTTDEGPEHDQHCTVQQQMRLPQCEDCSACSQVPQGMHFSPSATLQDVLDYLTDSASLQMKSPAITTTLDGKNKTLYLQTVASIEERTRPNLSKTLKELGLVDGQELAVADVTTPQTVIFKLSFT
ncbi:hypothetical protein NFI96_022171, partial [Prochilodus magdalenae]